MDIRIEVLEKGLDLVLPRPMADLSIAHQEAKTLAQVMRQAAMEVPETDGALIDFEKIRSEANKIKIGTNKSNVVLFFEWTSVLSFGRQAALLVAKAIELKAFDASLHKRDVIRFKV